MNKERVKKAIVLSNNIEKLERFLRHLKDKNKVVRVQSFPTIPIPKGCNTYDDSWDDICFIGDELKPIFIEAVDIKLKELEKELEEL